MLYLFIYLFIYMKYVMNKKFVLKFLWKKKYWKQLMGSAGFYWTLSMLHMNYVAWK